MKTALIVLLCSITALADSESDKQNDDKENGRKAREEYSRLLYDPHRDPWQLPDKVVSALAIGSSEVIADVEIEGDGGYFARRFARQAKTVYLVDINSKLLQHALKEKPDNLETIQSTEDDPKIQTRPTDTVFLCNVLNRIPNRPAYYLELAKSLKPQGRIVIIDFYKRTPPRGLPDKLKITEALVIAELKAAGFRLTRSFDLLPLQFFLIFQR